MTHKELTVLGRIVAEAAHDLNNVLAVTRDAGGLLRDIMATVKPSKLPHADKLQRIVESIDRQTKKGAETAKALNRFAHLTDEERAETDLAALVGLAMALTGRHASQRQTTMSAGHLPPGPMVEGEPMSMLLAVAACLRAALDAAPGGAVELATGKGKNGPEVRFCMQGRKTEPQPAFGSLVMEGEEGVLRLQPEAPPER